MYCCSRGMSKMSDGAHPVQSAQALLSYVRDLAQGSRELLLPLRDGAGAQVGCMRPLTRADLDDDSTVALLTDWRNAHRERFLSQFEATPRRTRAWLADVVLQRPGQLLFLVYGDSRLVGHYGFKDLRPDCVFLDNAMRGARGGPPDLFVRAGRALIDWLFGVAGVRRIEANVMADNVPAIMLNRSLGFEGWSKYPLRRTRQGDTVQWVRLEHAQDVTPDGYCYDLWMERHDAQDSDGPGVAP